MPLGRMLGLSLALMVISVGAVAKTADKSAPGHHAKSPSVKSVKSGSRPARSHVAARRHRRAAAPVLARSRSPDYDLPAARVDGPAELGDAVWYSFQGGRTANGDRMDGVTLTAAHRTLPLNSYAKVTNLDNGRSVVVKINDRGPVSHRYVIDLSKPAAEELDMMRSGTAAVQIEPVELEAAAPAGARPTVASYPRAAPAASQ